MDNGPAVVVGEGKEGLRSVVGRRVFDAVGAAIGAGPHDLWAAHNAGARRALERRLDELLSAGWCTADLVGALTENLAGVGSTMAVVLARARALEDRPPAADAAEAAGEASAAKRRAELDRGRRRGSALARVDAGDLGPAEADELLVADYGADPELLEAARAAYLAAGGAPAPGGDAAPARASPGTAAVAAWRVGRPAAAVGL